MNKGRAIQTFLRKDHSVNMNQILKLKDAMTGPDLLRHSFCALAMAAVFAAAPGSSPASAQPALADPGSAAGLTAHKALYDVSLVSAKNGSQIVNIRGQMYFEWKPSCEGWITDHRFTLSYDYADSPAMTISSDFSTFESFDNRNLSFTSRRKRDGEIYEELRGKASLNEKGAGSALYAVPDGLTFKLDPGVVFPTAQTIALLNAAKGGKKFYATTIFDGSDEEGPVEVSSFIGKPFKKGDKTTIFKRDIGFKTVAAGGSIDDKLLGPGWNVRMAFFPTLQDEPLSDYELTMALHDSGVISDMKIEYADFSVRQKLVALEKVSGDTCKN